MREAIAKAMATAQVTKLDRKNLTLNFDVKVGPECYSFFVKNGRDLLHLSGWGILEFDMRVDNTVNITMSGSYENSYR